MDILGSGTFGGGGVANVATQLQGMQGVGLPGVDLNSILGLLRRPSQPRVDKSVYAPRLSLEEQNVLHAQNAAKIAEANSAADAARAAMAPPPREYIHGLGYSGGPDHFMMNDSKMTGNQRKIFLPQNSSFTNAGITPTDQANALRYADSDKQMSEDLSGQGQQKRMKSLGEDSVADQKTRMISGLRRTV